MSFYRTLLATVAAFVLATPVFADDTQPAPMDNGMPAAQQPADTSAMAPAAAEAKVNVNTATAKDLMKVKGINASKARAIVAYRKKHGDFKSLDDLANVRGFKKMDADKMKAIMDQLTN